MVRNENINTINWSAHKLMVPITSACGEGSDEPACTHDLPRAFATRINNVCELKMSPNNFGHLVALDTQEWMIHCIS